MKTEADYQGKMPMEGKTASDVAGNERMGSLQECHP
jgi:hypothetical protein